MYRAVPAASTCPRWSGRSSTCGMHEASSTAAWPDARDGPVGRSTKGPPTANGTPGTHHVEARVFKDIFPRYRTMKGYHVPRKAGWDCHGLPVELAVERELGFTGKNDIEAYGIAEFNAKCRESVLRHVDEFKRHDPRGWATGSTWTTPTGRWTPTTSQSVWWSLQAHLRLRACWCRTTGSAPTALAAVPACPTTSWPRATKTSSIPLSTFGSRYLMRPLAERYPGLHLLVWTTTPWTLVSNTAVAVNPTADYVVARTADGEVFVVAEDLADSTPR